MKLFLIAMLIGMTGCGPGDLEPVPQPPAPPVVEGPSPGDEVSPSPTPACTLVRVITKTVHGNCGKGKPKTTEEVEEYLECVD